MREIMDHHKALSARLGGVPLGQNEFQGYADVVAQKQRGVDDIIMRMAATHAHMAKVLDGLLAIEGRMFGGVSDQAGNEKLRPEASGHVAQLGLRLEDIQALVSRADQCVSRLEAAI